MTSVYFSSHVFCLFRRLVNVVSTLSISKHCMSYDAHSHADHDVDHGGSIPTSLKDTTLCLKALQTSDAWPSLMTAQNWHSGMVEMRNTLYSQIPDISGSAWSWPRLFASPSTPTSQSEREPISSPSGDPLLSSNRKRDGSENGELPLKQKADPVISESSSTTPQHISPDIIHQLLVNPALYDPVRTPRFPIVLCHGLYGFDTRGPVSFPSMRMHYWSNVLRILRGVVGAEVIVTSVPGTGSITSRAEQLHGQLKSHVRGRGINFLAHSMGGLDSRYLISRIRPKEYVPLSLTTISTPHRGSPFMDWCANNIGIGKLRRQEKELDELKISPHRNFDALYDEYDDQETSYSPTPAPQPELLASKAESSFSFSSLPSSFVTLLLSVVDSPAYANLTSTYLTEVFNPSTPDDPHVKYWSVASRMNAASVGIWHPFWLPKMVLDGWEESERTKIKEMGASKMWEDEREWGNDGLVTIQSAKWGEFLGIMEGCDHWEMRGSRGIELGVDLPALPALGLGRAPHPTSTTIRPDPVQLSATATTAQQAQGDGWGFGDWMKFVGAWKKSESDEAAVVAKNAGMEKETQSEKDQREKRRETEAENTLKTSTNRMTVVFDWLIDRIPSPNLAISNKESVSKVDAQNSDAELRTNALNSSVYYGVSNSLSKAKQPTPVLKTPLAEVKEIMDNECKHRAKRRDLSGIQDLERFYVALAKRIWDSGL